MAVPSGEAFPWQFRALSTADRAAFIVDLLAARGWTAEHGETIVATRDGITRRFAVGAPASGRAVDVIVLTTEGTRADRIARAYDATVIGPPTIYSWLRYGIDRGAAIALSRAYLDTDPTPGPIPAPALPARARPSVAWLTRIRSPLAPRDVAGLVVLVSVIGLITIAALTGGVPMGAGSVPHCYPRRTHATPGRFVHGWPRGHRHSHRHPRRTSPTPPVGSPSRQIRGPPVFDRLRHPAVRLCRNR